MAEHIRVDTDTNEQLTELSKKRKKARAAIRSKQDINKEAVAALYKKEIKK